MTTINILADPRLRKKICGRLNKTFGCSKAYGCDKGCPVKIIQYTQEGMSEKNLPLGESYRLSLRKAVDKGEGRAIIREAVMVIRQRYPEKHWDEIYKESLSSACAVCQVLMDFRRKYEQTTRKEE